MRVTAAVLAFSLGVVGCGGDGPTEPSSVNVVGVYQLKSVNGGALPFALQAGPPRVDVTADQLSLNADGTYSEVSSYRITNGTTVTTTQSSAIGTYRAVNGQVQFTETAPATMSYSGSVSGSTLTLLQGSATFIYGR